MAGRSPSPAWTLSPVKPSHRFEVDVDGLQLIEQHYPFAGEANPQTALALHDLETGATRWIHCADAADDYLARVAFVKDGLAVQMLNRTQIRLRLKLIRLDDLSQCILIEENAAAWINLHDNFTAIGQDDYLWTSERDGASHLHRYRGGGCEQLTSGRGRVNRVLCADAQRVFFSGWFETPTEQHLYRLNLQSRELERLTAEGWHELRATEDRSWIIDHHSSLTTPKETRFGPPDGPLLPLRGVSFGNAREHPPASTEPRQWCAQGNADHQSESNNIASTGAKHVQISRDHPYHAFAAKHGQAATRHHRGGGWPDLHYRLTRPRHLAAPAPLIVYVYGGPGVQQGAQRLATPAAATVCPARLRGAGAGQSRQRQSGAGFRDRHPPAFWATWKCATKPRVAEFAAALPWVDGDRIGVFGHSYGGYMALMCLARVPKLFKAAVAVAPVTDWRLYDSCYTERYLGQPADNPEGYEASAVQPHLNDMQGALLLMHGMSDDNVVFTHSMRLMQALQERNKPFELMAYPNAKHSMQQRAVAIHRFNLILDFFARHLRPAPCADS